MSKDFDRKLAHPDLIAKANGVPTVDEHREATRPRPVPVAADGTARPYWLNARQWKVYRRMAEKAAFNDSQQEGA